MINQLDMTALPLIIINIVFDYFQIPAHFQTAKIRKREIVQARQVSMYFLRTFTNLSQHRVGSYFGKDHATVIHAVKTVNNLYDTDRGFRTDILTLKGKIDREKTSLELKISDLLDVWFKHSHYDTDNV
jgi:chromosomal replication initiation ATPase DnaA